MRNPPGVIGAAFNYALATNATSYARNQIANLIPGNDEKIEVLKLKEDYGLDSNEPLTRTQAEHRIKVKQLEEELGKSLRGSGRISGTVKSIMGSLGGAFLDPAAIILSVTAAVGVSGTLKGVQAYKIINIMKQGSFAAKYGTRAATFGTTEVAVNIGIGKAISEGRDEKYTPGQIITDGIFGLIFGTLFPIGLRSKPVKKNVDLDQLSNGNSIDYLKTKAVTKQDSDAIMQELSGGKYKTDDIPEVRMNQEDLNLFDELVENGARSDDFLEAAINHIGDSKRNPLLTNKGSAYKSAEINLKGKGEKNPNPVVTTSEGTLDIDFVEKEIIRLQAIEELKRAKSQGSK